MKKAMLCILLGFLLIGIPGCGEAEDIYPKDTSLITKLTISNYDFSDLTISTTDPLLIEEFFSHIPNGKLEPVVQEYHFEFQFTSCYSGEINKKFEDKPKQIFPKYLINYVIDNESFEFYVSQNSVSTSLTEYIPLPSDEDFNVVIEEYIISLLTSLIESSTFIELSVAYGVPIDFTSTFNSLVGNISFESLVTFETYETNCQITVGDREFYYYNEYLYTKTPIGESKIPATQAIIDALEPYTID